MDTQFAGRWCALSILHTPLTFSRKHLGMARYALKMLELMRWPQPHVYLLLIVTAGHMQSVQSRLAAVQLLAKWT